MIRYKYKTKMLLLDHIHGDLCEVDEIHFCISDKTKGLYWAYVEVFPDHSFKIGKRGLAYQVHDNTPFGDLMSAVLHRDIQIEKTIKELSRLDVLEEPLDYYVTLTQSIFN